MKFDAIFSNPTLENCFKRMVSAEPKERGGWLFHNFSPSFWPTKFSFRKLKAALQIEHDVWPMFIESFMFVPNKSDEPEVSYNVWDYGKAEEAAKLTGKAFGAPLHFHTHPGSTTDYSEADLGFAASCCELHKGRALFATVSMSPLRVHIWDYEYGMHRNPDHGSIKRGEFWSWRSKGLREILKEKP